LVPPLWVSVTVAVQLVVAPIGTVAGVQLTSVLVVRLFTVTVVDPELVTCWVVPGYLAVMVWLPVPCAVGV
jgi:hypothetical protein